MTASRLLIVNADDFGQSAAINSGIVGAHRNGIVSSASMMVRWPFAKEAATAATLCPGLSLGLHLDFGEWEFKDGDWRPVYEVVDLKSAAAIESELGKQLRAFEDLVGRAPTHCDSHQHVHLRSPIRELVVEMGRQRNIPIRHLGHVRYCGAFYGQDEEGFSRPDAISVEALIALIESLPDGVTEIACHPADGDDLATMYRVERMQELRTLCDPRVRFAAIKSGVQLISFRECK